MRKMQSFLFGIFVFLCVPWAYAGDSPWEKQLPFESATVVYKMSGTMTGEKIIYVKDFGRTTAEYASTTMKMMGMTHTQEEMILTTPKWVYSADLTEGTGTKQINPQTCMTEAYEQLSAHDQENAVKNAETMGVSILDGMGGTLEKNAATILGYPCDRVAMMGTSAYTIAGSALALKVEGAVMGMEIRQVAEELKTGPVPASKFELPQGIQFVNDPETDRMIREQATSVLQNLVAGNHPDDGQAALQSAHQAAHQSAHQATDDGIMDETRNETGNETRNNQNMDPQNVDPQNIDQVREGLENAVKGLFN